MANFTPEGTIHIGRVPFDNSYRHTIDCFTEATQASVMQGFCTRSLSRADYTYVRMNNSIRVPYNAEDLYTYNYVMYQNSNYGTKWFYAFITAINYLNENCTELVLELDVLQTWWFDWTREECFVEREHVNDDSVGTHTNPEPEMPFNKEVKERFTDDELYSKYIIVQTNAKPHYSGGTEPDGSDTVDGGLYQRVYSGCKYYAYDFIDAGSDEPVSVFLRDMNKAGAADSITGIFMFPKTFTPNVGSDHGIQSEVLPAWQDRQTSRPTSLGGGYVPHNNKLFTYPYCYCRLSDNNGANVELKYELWDAYDGEYHYQVSSAVDPTAQCVVAPNAYAGMRVDYQNALSFPVTAQCSWPYSSYQTWQAQNALGNALTVATNVALMAVPAAKGISAAGKALGVGLKSDANMIRSAALQGRSAVLPSSANMLSAAATHGASSIGTAGLAAMGMGAMGLSNFAAEYSRQSNIPDVTRGQCSGNTLAQLRLQTYNCDQVVITEEYAKIVDGFLDMYGYQVDALKKPNMKGRKSWNYVKCQNSANHGNVPAPDMAAINRIMDSGLTIWHTTEVGNYSLDNSIS